MSYTWEDLSGERIVRWPSKTGEKRPIRVEVFSWVGVSPGAKHYNVRIVEHRNEFWCERDNRWVDIYEWSHADGFRLDADCYSEDEIAKVANHFLKLMFDPAKHEIDICGNLADDLKKRIKTDFSGKKKK